MKQMFEPFTKIKISENHSSNTGYTEYVLKERDGVPKQFSILIKDDIIATGKFVVINAERFLASSTLRTVPSGCYNSKTVDFAIIDFRNLDTDKQIKVYLIELGNHTTHELQLKYNSAFSIITAFISKHMQLTLPKPADENFKFECIYKLVHVIEPNIKTLMVSSTDNNIIIDNHSKKHVTTIEINATNFSCQFEALESLSDKHLTIESLTI